MKKIFYLMSICALAFVSCQKEELAGNEAADGKYTYTFTVDHTAEAKASVGDKNGTQWPVLWSEGDQIGIYGGDTFYGTAVLTSGAGENTGVFTLNTSEELEIGGEYFVSYPYVEGAATKTGKVAAEHTLSASGIGANAFAYAYMDYEGDNTAFTLTHTNAYLKFNVSSEKFAGYQLTGVTLWASGAELSGAIEVGNGDAVTTTGDGDYVKTILSEPVTVSAAAQPVWLTALPCDLSAKTVYAIVHMTKGIETVTLPVKLNGAKTLQAGAVTEITLPALTKSLAPSWYEPVETRYIAAYGDGWSYGPENTVLFPTKGVAKTVELKARGNFMKVKEPKYVQIIYACDLVTKTTGIVKYDGTTDSHNGTSFIEHPIGDDYSVNIQIDALGDNTPSGQISAMVVKDSDKNTVWGINLWACFKALVTKSYTNGDVLTWNIGTGYDATNRNYRSNGCYFQWGRPWALPWSSSMIKERMILVDPNISMEASCANPYTFHYYDGTAYNWFWDNRESKGRSDINDLWGNPDGIKESGVKSIYDPCPRGYRVISFSILQEVMDSYEVVETTVKDKEDKWIYLKYKDVTWGFAGLFSGGLSTGGPNKLGGGTNLSSICAYWSNYASNFSGYLMHFQSGLMQSNNRAKASMTPIRCMVDTENR